MAQREYMQNPTVTRTAEIDAGLRVYMNKVYALMAGAMIITGLVAYIVGMDFKAAVNGEETLVLSYGVLQAMFSSPIKWVLMFAPLAFVILFAASIHKMSAATAQTVFWVFGAGGEMPPRRGAPSAHDARSRWAIPQVAQDHFAPF